MDRSVPLPVGQDPFLPEDPYLPKYIHFDKDEYRGPINDLKAQRVAVSFLIKEIGFFFEGALQPALNKCSKYLGPIGPKGTRTIRRWWNYYLMYGELPGVAWRRRWRRNHGKRKREGDTWSKRWAGALREVVESDPTLFVDEIHRQYVRQTGDDSKSDKQIWLQMKRMGLTLQVVSYVAAERCEEERAAYQAALEIDCRGRPEMLVFVDETMKGKNEARRTRAWMDRGGKAELPAFLHSEDKLRYSMLSAVNIDGFIPQACEPVLRETSPTDPDLGRGTIDRERFMQWARERLLPVLGNYALGERNSLVVLDNAIIHHDDELIDIIEGEGRAKILWLSRYSPDFNPIEYFFHQYKMSLRRNVELARRDWIAAHDEALMSVDRRAAVNTFRKCGIFVPGELDPKKEEGEELLLLGAAIAVVATVLK
mmetsp:Transcript_9059/g.25521  ORF Transcript_9059/g.25521 Transcript_9059/m.25521 type:complete len:425 (+) Transcript_9059:2157-3431(+)